jgi:hypothetical protein
VLRGALLALLLAVPLSASAAPLPIPIPPPPGVPNPAIPPVGNQPSDPVTNCQLKPLGASEFRPVYQSPTQGGPGAAKKSSFFTVDPSNGCHMYVSKTTDIDRSDNGGGSYNPDFSDQSQAATLHQGPITISKVRTAGPGQVWFFDMTGTNGVFYSPAYGNQSWEQRDNGLYTSGAAGPTGGILDLVVAPSNHTYVYLLGQSGGQSVIFKSVDTGLHWQAITAPPVPDVTSLAVDPGDPNHLFAAGGGFGTTTNQPAGVPASVPGFTFDSSDGLQWTQHNAPDSAISPVELLPVLDNAHLLRIYARTQSADGSQQRWDYSIDAMATWHKVILPLNASGQEHIAYNPANPKEMVVAVDALNADKRPVLEMGYSTDGLKTVRYQHQTAPLPAATQDLDLTADNSGTYYMKYTINGIDTVLAFKVTALYPVPANPTTITGAIPMKTCPLPTIGGNPSNTAGSLTFDGTYLDFTEDEQDPGVIYQLSPATCLIRSMKVNASETGGVLPILIDITYDPRYDFHNGDIGAILARANGGGTKPQDSRVSPWDSAIYAIDPVTQHTELLMTLPCQPVGDTLPDWRCKDLPEPKAFAYDPYRDALWAPSTRDPGSGYPVPGLVAIPKAPSAAPGVAIDTCMSRLQIPDRYSANTDKVDSSMSSWEPGARGILYVQLEDDANVLRVNSDTCQILDSFTHTQYSEGKDEDDQMACDPLTFSQEGPLPQTPPTSALWIRDAYQVPDPNRPAPKTPTANDVSAYAITDGFCPFPDALTVKAPLSGAVSTPATICATLRAITSGVAGPLANRVIQFSMDGKVIGSATTDANGYACLTFTLPPNGGPHSFSAAYAGNEAFLPVTAGGVIQVLGGAAQAGPPGPPGFRAVPPNPPPQPPLALIPAPPAPVPQPQVQPQPQAQAQAQTQPGVMTQKQRQTRVSMARIDGGRIDGDLEASRAGPALAVQGSGLALFGLALFLYRRALRRRPKPSVSRIPSDRGRRR